MVFLSLGNDPGRDNKVVDFIQFVRDRLDKTFNLVPVDIRNNPLASLLGRDHAAVNKGLDFTFCLCLFSSLYEKKLGPAS
jgi:hypothetical protein